MHLVAPFNWVVTPISDPAVVLSYALAYQVWVFSWRFKRRDVRSI
jgi:hypothetical protein